jgi:hypothetical protein
MYVVDERVFFCATHHLFSALASLEGRGISCDRQTDMSCFEHVRYSRYVHDINCDSFCLPIVAIIIGMYIIVEETLVNLSVLNIPNIHAMSKSHCIYASWRMCIPRFCIYVAWLSSTQSCMLGLSLSESRAPCLIRLRTLTSGYFTSEVLITQKSAPVQASFSTKPSLVQLSSLTHGRLARSLAG